MFHCHYEAFILWEGGGENRERKTESVKLVRACVVHFCVRVCAVFLSVAELPLDEWIGIPDVSNALRVHTTQHTLLI